jgi:phospholipase C
VEPAATPSFIGSAKIDHVVVAMMENRSFDNLVGWLYAAENNQPPINIPHNDNPSYAGLEENKYWNSTSSGRPVPATNKGTTSTKVPDPDPLEQFRHMNYQVFGKQNPTEGQEATMDGFVRNYEEAIKKDNKTSQPDAIMETYAYSSKKQVPVLSTLARNYAICDRWFGSVPCQTWPNRAFLHAGTSCGRVNNLDKADDDYTPPNPKYYNTKTIFNYLQEIGVSWKVYNDATFLPSLTRAQFSIRLGYQKFNENFRSLEKFEKDAANGNLPAYSFLEPGFLNKGNDYHPPHDVNLGEEFLYRVWKAVSNGKKWNNTLLIITFDEHGGCYDHVPPPWTATKPDNSKPQKPHGEAKPFGFNRYGVRVPTILVSPYIEAGTVFRSDSPDVEYDHTSILKTIQEWVDKEDRHTDKRLKSKRIPKAPSIGVVLTLDNPREENDKPNIPAPRITAAMRKQSDAPLNSIQASIVAATMLQLDGDIGFDEVVKKIGENAKTRKQALKYLKIK